MLIKKSIKNFIVFREDTILDALIKIEDNKHGVIFVLDYNGILEGIITDGDFRRWLTKDKTFELNVDVTNVMNNNFITHSINDTPEIINASFQKK